MTWKPETHHSHPRRTINLNKQSQKVKYFLAFFTVSRKNPNFGGKIALFRDLKDKKHHILRIFAPAGTA
jgi:hypothetical protein